MSSNTSGERNHSASIHMISLKRIIVAVAVLLSICCLSRPATAADEEVCLGCHGYVGLKAKSGEEPLQDFHVDGETFNGSVHGALQCRACHADIRKIPHEEKPHEVSCGISCHRFTKGESSSHADLYNEYLDTSHGKSLNHGPHCLYCHGRNERPDYSEGMRADMDDICARCHTVDSLGEDGRPNDSTVIEDVHHRLSIARGLGDTPGCVDCHPAHGIYAGTDERSSINADNMEATCGGADIAGKRCHATVTENLAGRGIHDPVVADRIARRAESGMLWMFVILLTAPLALHMVFDSLRASRATPTESFPEISPGVSGDAERSSDGVSDVLIRMTLHQRALHLVLMLLFIVASLSGLTLRLSDTPASAGAISAIGGFEAMTSLHLVASLSIAALIIYHVVSLVYLSVKRDWSLGDLAVVPNTRDLKDIIQNARFLLFLSADAPRFARYNFVQKFDYFAALFGLGLMVASGLAVGMPERSVALIPAAYLGDLRALHGALGYILVFVFLAWHVYHNLLAPGKFFANWSWLVGTMPEAIIARDHAAHYEEFSRLRHDERLEKEKAAEKRSIHKIITKQSRRLEEYLEAGNDLAREEEYEKAIEQYGNALELLPNFPQARYNLAAVYHKSGDLKRAAAEYRNFLEMDPFNAMADKVRSMLREVEEAIQKGSEEGSGEGAGDEG